MTSKQMTDIIAVLKKEADERESNHKVYYKFYGLAGEECKSVFANESTIEIMDNDILLIKDRSSSKYYRSVTYIDINKISMVHLVTFFN